MGSGQFWGALVVHAEDAVDDALLTALAAGAGIDLAFVGSGGFGGETTADVYADESGATLLIEAEAIEVGVRALLIRANSELVAIGLRDVIGSRCRAWPEQALRAQLEAGLEDDPATLVALMMATGGAEPEPETADLLHRALNHENPDVRELAEYAAQVAAEIADQPVIRPEAEASLPEVLRPATPVDDEPDWVTVRAGVPERAVPGAISWLRVPAGSSDDLVSCGYTHDWWPEVVDDGVGPEWREQIQTTEDRATAIHYVEHPALDGGYVAIHGADPATVVTVLRDELDAELLDAAPPGLDHTAP